MAIVIAAKAAVGAGLGDDPEDVVAWLQENGLGQHSDKFLSMHINHRRLREMNDTTLTESVGMTTADIERLRVLSEKVVPYEDFGALRAAHRRLVFLSAVGLQFHPRITLLYLREYHTNDVLLPVSGQAEPPSYTRLMLAPHWTVIQHTVPQLFETNPVLAMVWLLTLVTKVIDDLLAIRAVLLISFKGWTATSEAAKIELKSWFTSALFIGPLLTTVFLVRNCSIVSCKEM